MFFKKAKMKAKKNKNVVFYTKGEKIVFHALNTQRLIGSSQAVFEHIVSICIICKHKYIGICTTSKPGPKSSSLATLSYIIRINGSCIENCSLHR